MERGGVDVREKRDPRALGQSTRPRDQIKKKKKKKGFLMLQNSF